MTRLALAAAALLSAGGCVLLAPPPPKEDAAALAKLSEAAAAGFDERALLSSLEAILAWHRRNNPLAARALRPGLSDAQIDAAAAGLPFRLPRELRALYRWRDGMEPGPHFLVFHRFLPLRAAVERYRERRRWGAWDASWLPVFETEGDTYFVRCPDTPSEAEPVRYHIRQETHHWVAYVNLTLMTRTAAETLVSGAVKADPRHGSLLEDPAMAKPIHARHNPGATYPYYVQPGPSPL